MFDKSASFAFMQEAMQFWHKQMKACLQVLRAAQYVLVPVLYRLERRNWLVYDKEFQRWVLWASLELVWLVWVGWAPTNCEETNIAGIEDWVVLVYFGEHYQIIRLLLNFVWGTIVKVG